MDLKPHRQLTYRRLEIRRQSLQRQQELMLARLETGATSCSRAEIEKTSNLITKLGERTVILDGEFYVLILHGRSLSYYDVL